MKNKVIPILLIIWAVLFFLFGFYYSKITTDILVKAALTDMYGDYNQLKVGFENLYVIIRFAFLITLIIMCIINIVKCKKNKVKVLSGGYGVAILGLALQILGMIGISWIVILIAAIMMLIENKKTNNI